MGQYYYLISGLPELQLDDQKLKLTLAEFKAELKEHLSKSDWEVLSYFFMQFDNENLLKVLKNPEAEINHLGNLDEEELRDILMLYKETDAPVYPGNPRYFNAFVPAYLAEEEAIPGMTWGDQLTSLYYDHAIAAKNSFVAEWFQLNLNISNVLTAYTCMKYGYDREASVVGSNEIAEAIRNNNARDFGIAAEFPEVEEVIRIAEETDIYEKERKIDVLKWKWLEEKGFFHYFDVEHLFIYLVRLQMLSRWVKLEKETGLKVFREMINLLQHSFEFPNEFTVKKVAGN